MRTQRRVRTTRARLVLAVTGLLLAALVVLGAVSVVILRQNLVSQAESTLYLSNDATRTQVAASLDADETPVVPEFATPVPPDGFYVVLKGGVPVQSAFFTRDYSYRPLSDGELGDVDAASIAADETGTLALTGQGQYLVTSSPVGLEDDEYTVVTGVGLTDADGVVATYAVWLGAIGLAVAALAAGLGYRLVTRELDPLEHVAEVAQQVAESPLSSGEVAPQGRVPRDPRLCGSEADRVAMALNRLLDHVEASLNTRHRAEESMRRFIAEASHELRNPLASIRGYADFYSRTPADPDETAAALARVGSEAERMSTLVDDLLLLARLDADPRVTRDEVDLSRVVFETTSDARFAFPDHSWQLALPDDPVTVIGDEDAIRQILLNLIANAGHHTPPDTAVRVSIAVEGDETVLSVADDGPGIPAEALPTIFDRFTQAGGEQDSTRKNSTVGLGLAIVKALAAASDYRIDVDSDGGGTRFTVTIPS